jgi:hypothetical protein
LIKILLRKMLTIWTYCPYYRHILKGGIMAHQPRPLPARQPLAALELNRLVFNVRLVAAFEDGISATRATNAVLAALEEGIEKNIFPLWAKCREGYEYEISLEDYEIYP